MENEFYVLRYEPNKRYARIHVYPSGEVALKFDGTLDTCSKFGHDRTFANGIVNLAIDMCIGTLELVPVVRQKMRTTWERWEGQASVPVYYVVEDSTTKSLYAFDISAFPGPIGFKIVTCYADATRFSSRNLAEAMSFAAQNEYRPGPCKLVPIVEVEVVDSVWKIKE